MKNQFNLSVKKPCFENFNQFKPTTDGGFCGACKKEVIDFTNMDSKEIISYFSSNNTQNTCGRFKSKQLKTYNMKNPRNKKINFLTGIGLACLTLFSFTSVQAQEVTTTEVKTLPAQSSFVIKGNVTDANGPLPGANVILKGTRTGIATDFAGNFEFPIKLKKGDVLIFSYVGMETQLVTIKNRDSAANILLELDSGITEIIVVGKVATKKVYSSKKNKDN